MFLAAGEEGKLQFVMASVTWSVRGVPAYLRGEYLRGEQVWSEYLARRTANDASDSPPNSRPVSDAPLDRVVREVICRCDGRQDTRPQPLPGRLALKRQSRSAPR
ncbi:hypothetical protein O3P69_000938 [Scylla paramamosain]|uniref:Uncharacterized protein n=1 Tax=Scylla paramamosain TaxID=85552 RepID=A0AAW0UU50_SCYPA